MARFLAKIYFICVFCVLFCLCVQLLSLFKVVEERRCCRHNIVSLVNLNVHSATESATLNLVFAAILRVGEMSSRL